MGEGAAPIGVPEEPKASNKWGVIIAIVTVLGTITVALINRPHSKVETVKQISVDGRITDENGPVSNAQVTLEQTGTGTVQATSHSDGDFHFDRVSTTRIASHLGPSPSTPIHPPEALTPNPNSIQ